MENIGLKFNHLLDKIGILMQCFYNLMMTLILISELFQDKQTEDININFQVSTSLATIFLTDTELLFQEIKLLQDKETTCIDYNFDDQN